MFLQLATVTAILGTANSIKSSTFYREGAAAASVYAADTTPRGGIATTVSRVFTATRRAPSVIEKHAKVGLVCTQLNFCFYTTPLLFFSKFFNFSHPALDGFSSYLHFNPCCA